MKQYWLGEIHKTTTEKYMENHYPNTDFGFELIEDRLIARVIKV